MLQGPDISSYQGFADWGAVAASGRQFGWCKSTEGTNYINPYFTGNWGGMWASGILRGAYHFGRPDLNSPQDEVDYFLRVVGDLNPGDRLALDLEKTGQQNDLLSWALDFLGILADKIGFLPMLYSGDWFLEPHNVWSDPELGKYGLWLASYTNGLPQLPPAWQALAMWQDTDNASIPGINGPVDESYFFGTIDQLRSYGMSPVPQVPELTSALQLVTIDSVIGDNTYPDGSNIDDLAPNQPVSHRQFIRQLVQHAKTLSGLSSDSVTRLSVMGDMTYPDGSNIDDPAPNQPAGTTKRTFIRLLVQQDKASVGA